MDENDAPPYRIEAHDNSFDVVSPADVVVIACRDRHSAQHYAELLNRAYRVGFKAGYRHYRRLDRG